MKKKMFYEYFDSLYYYHGVSQNWEAAALHLHSQYEVILFMNDGMQLETNSRIYEAGRGDLFFINDKVYHRVSGKKGTPYERYVLMFDPGIIQNMSAELDFDYRVLFESTDEEEIRNLHLSGYDLERTEELLSEIDHIISRGVEKRHNWVQLKVKLIELLNMLDAQGGGDSEEENCPKEGFSFARNAAEEIVDEIQESPAPLAYRERTERIKQYISEHIEEQLNLEGLAGRFHISRYYLSHSFKKDTGFTLTQYITNRKIGTAKKMLMSGMSVTEVARQLSYKSNSHFVTVFKRNTGVTPKQYAKGRADKD